MPTVKTSKEEIIKKSALIIWGKGYKHTSFSDLSKACDIRNAHFYYYFKDKEDLMYQVLEYARDFINKKIFDIAYQEELSVEERLITIGKKLKKLYFKNNSGCMFANITLEMSHTEVSFLEIVRSTFKDFIAALKHLFEYKLPSEEAQKKASIAVQQIEGALMMMRLYNDQEIFDHAWENISN